ncbi:hypothetical protein [Treponema pedis]|nr:hypothetical protein [Treponema pedis]
MKLTGSKTITSFSREEIENLREVQKNKLISETSQEYVMFLAELENYQLEYKSNPSDELKSKINELEAYGLREFPDWIITSSNSDNSSTHSARSTYSSSTWRDSVRAVGSFDFVTVWWTESYIPAEIYKIYRRNRTYSNSYYYRGSVTPTQNDDEYYRDYYVTGNTYYDYQATAFENGESYYHNAFVENVYVPQL